MKKRILLAGGYNIAKAISICLINNGYEVTAINPNYNECKSLAEIDSLNIINDSPVKPYVLSEAGAANADAVIALTENDSDNIVICELCKKQFNAEKTVCLIKSDENKDIFGHMGVDSVISSTNIVAAVIEQLTLTKEFSKLMPVGNGKFNVAEIAVTDNAVCAGKKLGEIELPSEAYVGCLLRKENNIIPAFDTVILPGDILILLCPAAKEQVALKKLF